jgi:hypothetical protein
VVWLVTEREWERAEAEADEPNGIPWPTADVMELAPA